MPKPVGSSGPTDGEEVLGEGEYHSDYVVSVTRSDIGLFVLAPLALIVVAALIRRRRR